MQHPHPEELDARLRRLEAVVDELQRTVRQLEGGAPAPAAPPPAPAIPAAPAAPAAPRPWPAAVEPVLNGEFWLSKLGIGLLLLGVAFLFKYSIDQGWITPVVRLGFGTALAAALTGAGLRLHRSQRNLSLVLLGGGVATFYMVGFAASQLYGLLPTAGSLALMSVVTAFAFLLSLREEEALLTVVATLGGLGTPFLLYPRTGSPALLSAYVGSIVLWNGVVFARRRWHAALTAAALGSWLALVSGLVVSERAGPVVGSGRWALLAAVAAAWVVFGVLPAALSHGAGREEDDDELAYAAMLAFVSPFVTLGLTAALWSLSGREWGLAAGVAGGAYLGWAYTARGRSPRMAAVLAVTGAALVATGTVAGVEGELRWVLLAAQGLALHLAARRGAGAGVEWCGHVIFLGLAVVVLAHMAARPLEALFADGAGRVPTPVLNPRGIADLAVIAAAFAASFFLRGGARLAYRLGAHAGVLQWTWREFAGVRGGEGIVSALWGVYGVGLLAAATLRGMALLQTVAKATLLVLLAKMFLVDLRALEALWRVLLFSGLGGLFLLLSYYVGRRRPLAGGRG